MTRLRNRRDHATHWSTTPDGFGGYTYGTPEVLRVRWEEIAEQFIDTKGVETVSRSKVFLDKDVSAEDYLFHGESAVADPTTVDTAEQVRQIQSIPDLRNLSAQKVAFL